ncbi:MAG: DUF1573 domain-containing protein [Phycisphaerales bacterium]
MYRFFRGRLNSVPGDLGFMSRRAAGFVILVGLVGLSPGCKESDGSGGAAVSPIIASGSEDGTGGAATPTVAARGGLQVPQTQPANRGGPPTLQAAADNLQSTTNVVSSSPAPVVFDPPAVDLGYILPNQKVNTIIQVRNAGDAPLKITLVKPSCTCTTLNDLTGTVIPPGESVSLTAQLKAWSTPSPLTSSITFLFEGYAESSQVSISGQVTRPIRTEPQLFNCVTGKPLSGRVAVESIDGRPFTILAANRQPPEYIGFDPATDEPRNAYALRWDVSQYTEQTMPGWWLIETDHPDCPVVDVWVRHQWNFPERVPGRPWRLRTQHVVIDGINAGETAEFTVDIAKLGRDDIYSVHSLSNEFDAKLVSIQRDGADAEVTVRITPAAGHHGLLYGTIEFLSGAYYQKLTVIGTVIE